MVFDKKLAVNLNEHILYMSYFSLVIFKNLFQQFDYDVCKYGCLTLPMIFVHFTDFYYGNKVCYQQIPSSFH